MDFFKWLALPELRECQSGQARSCRVPFDPSRAHQSDAGENEGHGHALGAGGTH